ncbi:MAG: hypothetical protein ABIA76_04505 [Candidatus Diapherotrites archaeon]
MLGKLFLFGLLVFFLAVLGGLFVVRGVVEEMEKQGLNLSGLDEISGSNGSGKIQDPNALYNGSQDPKTIQNPDEINSDNITSKEATEAYQKYIAAYNKLTELMAQGKGDTPEAQQAYQEYKEAKENYEQIAKGLK